LQNPINTIFQVNEAKICSNRKVLETISKLHKDLRHLSREHQTGSIKMPIWDLREWATQTIEKYLRAELTNMMKEIRCKQPLSFNLVLHLQENLRHRCKLKTPIDHATFVDKRRLLRKREDKSWRGRMTEDNKQILETKPAARNERSCTL
jgi:hypothetical protein